MQLIESKTLGSAQASIEFTNIPQDGTDLLLVVSGRTDSTGSTYMTINPNDAATSVRTLRGSGSSVSSGTDPSNAYADMPNGSDTASTFGNVSVYFPNYASTTINKSFSIDGVTENNGTTARQIIAAGLYASNTAITSLKIYAADANLIKNLNFVSGSSASLYKITKGSDGTTTVA